MLYDVYKYVLSQICQDDNEQCQVVQLTPGIRWMVSWFEGHKQHAHARTHTQTWRAVGTKKPVKHTFVPNSQAAGSGVKGTVIQLPMIESQRELILYNNPQMSNPEW